MIMLLTITIGLSILIIGVISILVGTSCDIFLPGAHFKSLGDIRENFGITIQIHSNRDKK